MAPPRQWQRLLRIGIIYDEPDARDRLDFDVRRLFNGLLVWGLAMAVGGAVLCWLLFG